MDARDFQALWTAILYFGSFAAIGWGGRRLIDHFMGNRGVTLSEAQDQLGESRRKQTGFLLGVWYRRGR